MPNAICQTGARHTITLGHCDPDKFSALMTPAICKTGQMITLAGTATLTELSPLHQLGGHSCGGHSGRTSAHANWRCRCSQPSPRTTLSPWRHPSCTKDSSTESLCSPSNRPLPSWSLLGQNSNNVSHSQAQVLMLQSSTMVPGLALLLLFPALTLAPALAMGLQLSTAMLPAAVQQHSHGAAGHHYTLHTTSPSTVTGLHSLPEPHTTPLPQSDLACSAQCSTPNKQHR